MPKWHFLVVLDSNEYQILGITIIIHVYYVLIIGSVFYALCLVSAYSCIGHASHMHSRCTFAARILTLDMFCTSLMLVKSFQTFQHLICSCVYVMPKFTSCSIVLSMSCSLCFVAFFSSCTPHASSFILGHIFFSFPPSSYHICLFVTKRGRAYKLQVCIVISI